MRDDSREAGKAESRRRSVKRILISLALSLPLSLSIPAQEADSPVLSPEISAEVRAVITHMATAEFTSLRGVLRVMGNAPVGRGASPEAPNRAVTTDIHVALAPPNRFRIEVHSPTPRGDGLFVSDGRRVRFVSPLVGREVSMEAPASYAEIGPEPLALCGAASVILPALMGMDNPLEAILSHPPRAGLEPAHVRSVTRQVVASAPCDIVEISQRDSAGAVITTDYGVDAETGLLRAFVLRVEDPERLAEPWARVEQFTSLEINGPVTDEDFEVTAAPASH
jgi:outer membrane lipoprotein-sorting protein